MKTIRTHAVRLCACALGLMAASGVALHAGTTGPTGPGTTTAKYGSGTIVDAANKEVGTLVQQNLVSVKVGSLLVVINTSVTGFTQQDSGNIQFYHGTADCSGQRYMDATGLPEQSQVNGDTIYFASKPATNLTIGSLEYFSSGVDLSQPGQCVPFSGVSLIAGPVTTASISALGFVAPFSVQ